jgi:predicted MFS family arabinose efflux permease
MATSPPDDAGIRVTFRESSVAVKAVLVGVFVSRLGAFLQVFLLLFLTHRGFTAVQAGVALGCYGAGSVIGELLSGSMSDRLGPRRTILLGMSGTAALILAVLYVANYPGLLAAVVVVGAVSHIYRTASATLLSELTPEHRQVMIFAMYRLAMNLGTTAAPLIGTALITVSYGLLFWVEAIAAAGFALIAVTALPRDPDARRPEPAGSGAGQAEDAVADLAGTDLAPADLAAAGTADGSAGRGAGDAGTPAPAEPAAAGRRDGYLALLGDRRYLLYLAAMLVNAAVYFQYVSTLPLAMRSAGLAVGWYGAMVALNGFIVITCELLVTKVVQHWPARAVIATGFTLIGGGFACYALPWGLAAFVVGTLGWTLAEIIGGPTMFAYPARTGPARLRGHYIGSAYAMFGVGSAIGPIAGVWLFDEVGNQVWVWCGIVSLLGLAAAWQGMRSSPAAVATPAMVGERSEG